MAGLCCSHVRDVVGRHYSLKLPLITTAVVQSDFQVHQVRYCMAHCQLWTDRITGIMACKAHVKTFNHWFSIQYRIRKQPSQCLKMCSTLCLLPDVPYFPYSVKPCRVTKSRNLVPSPLPTSLVTASAHSNPVRPVLQVPPPYASKVQPARPSPPKFPTTPVVVTLVGETSPPHGSQIGEHSPPKHFQHQNRRVAHPPALSTSILPVR